MPAIQVLGCCSRLGTWSTACRRAGFLQLSSKTCRDGAGGFPQAAGGAGPAEDAAGIARSMMPRPAPLAHAGAVGPGSRYAQRHGSCLCPAFTALRRAVAVTCASWRGAVTTYLEQLCCKETVLVISP